MNPRQEQELLGTLVRIADSLEQLTKVVEEAIAREQAEQDDLDMVAGDEGLLGPGAVISWSCNLCGFMWRVEGQPPMCPKCQRSDLRPT